MDALAQKVVQRYADQIAKQIVNKEEIRKRIEAIPGWQRSNFLMSLHRQADRYPLSDKQLAVLDKIEREQGANTPSGPSNTPRQAPSGHIDVRFDPRKQYFDRDNTNHLVRALTQKHTVTVFDPHGLLAKNAKLQEFLINELTSGFYGQAERYAENNADEEDEQRRRHNYDMQGRNEAAAYEMQKAKMHVKQDGPLATVTVVPAYSEVVRKHRLN